MKYTMSVSPKALKVSDIFAIVTMFAALRIEPLHEMAMLAMASSRFRRLGPMVSIDAKQRSVELWMGRAQVDALHEAHAQHHEDILHAGPAFEVPNAANGKCVRATWPHTQPIHVVHDLGGLWLKDKQRLGPCYKAVRVIEPLQLPAQGLAWWWLD
jgi:hypothetical protein